MCKKLNINIYNKYNNLLLKLEIVTIILVFYLNNNKKRMGGNSKEYSEKPTANDAQTKITSIGDTINRYIFSNDVCYDFDIRLSDISNDTKNIILTIYFR